MKILKNIKVPTGNILIIEGDKGKLECLSLGDYGKEKNIKADFLNLTKELNGVPHGDLMPLEKKWVITISSQYGCDIGCEFCDVSKVGKGINATVNDLFHQIKECVNLHPEVKNTERLNIHFARMGEPTFNPNILYFSKYCLKQLYPRFNIHPVVSTMMPRYNNWLEHFIEDWLEIKSDIYNGNAGLQISINSTNEEERFKMFKGKASTLFEIHKMFLFNKKMSGRKITLNFALSDYTIDAKELIKYFDPERFMCKITPMHVTKSCKDKKIITPEGYTTFKPYKKVEEDLKSVGYDVIVFVPSLEEDISRITCGNAILSDKEI